MGVVLAQAAAEHNKGEGTSPQSLKSVREIDIVLDGGELVGSGTLGDEEGPCLRIACDRLSKLVEDGVEVGLSQLPSGA